MSAHSAPATRVLTVKPTRCDTGGSLASILQPSDSNKVAASKVMVTLGPATRSPEVMEELLRQGIAAARFDLTWGTLAYHLESLARFQAAARATTSLVATCLDLCGRNCSVVQRYELEASGFPRYERAIVIADGQRVIVTARPDAQLTVPEDASQPVVLPVSSDEVARVARVGDTVNVERYLVTALEELCVSMEVQLVADLDVLCVSRGPLNIHGAAVVRHIPCVASAALPAPTPALNESDRVAMRAFHAAGGLDFVILGDLDDPADVDALRDFLDAAGASQTRIIATVQSARSLLHFGAIVQQVDGIILARGPLGLHVLPEKVAVIQKRVIQLCNLVGKPCIVSSILDSMQENPRPTRAEATDVANSVIDGADAFLLGPETVRGKNPVLCVATVQGICREAERVFDNVAHYDTLQAVFREADFDEKSPTWVQSHLVSSASGIFSPEVVGTGEEEDGGVELGAPRQLSRLSPRPSPPDAQDPSMHKALSAISESLGGLLSMTGNELSPGAPPTPLNTPADHGAPRPHVSWPEQPASELVSPRSSLGRASGGADAGGLPRVKAHAHKFGSYSDLAMNAMRRGSGSDNHIPASGLRKTCRVPSWGTLACASPGGGSSPRGSHGNLVGLHAAHVRRLSQPQLQLTSVEVAASSAVLMADHVQSPLIVVITDTGHTASLIAKYRPAAPILALVVPHIVRTGFSWTIQGSATARQCGLLRGVVPMLAAPSAQAMLPAALARAVALGLARPQDNVVAVVRMSTAHSGECLTVQVMQAGESAAVEANHLH